MINEITIDVETTDIMYGEVVLEITFLFNPADPLDFSSDWNYEGNIDIISVKAYDSRSEIKGYNITDNEIINFIKIAIRDAEISNM